MIFINYLQGILNLSVKTFAILFLVFILLELVQRSGLLAKGTHRSEKFIGFMGFNRHSYAPLLAGIMLGIIYGAGVIDDLFKRENIDKKQIFLVAVFLAMCHAIFEDTGLFLVLGANLFWITVPRILLAILITYLCNKIFSDKP